MSTTIWRRQGSGGVQPFGGLEPDGQAAGVRRDLAADVAGGV